MPAQHPLVGGAAAQIDRPSKRIVAAARRHMPAIVFSSVDLPAPLAPMTATVSPSATAIETPNSACEVAVAGVDAVDLEQPGHVDAVRLDAQVHLAHRSDAMTSCGSPSTSTRP